MIRVKTVLPDNLPHFFSRTMLVRFSSSQCEEAGQTQQTDHWWGEYASQGPQTSGAVVFGSLTHSLPISNKSSCSAGYWCSRSAGVEVGSLIVCIPNAVAESLGEQPSRAHPAYLVIASYIRLKYGITTGSLALALVHICCVHSTMLDAETTETGTSPVAGGHIPTTHHISYLTT